MLIGPILIHLMLPLTLVPTSGINNAINNNPPMPGRTHDLIGWLAQPIEKWPYFSISEMLNGDKEVGERIIKKLSGYNNESLLD